MRDISNFGNNLRDEIIEYRLEHETGYTLKIKFVDNDDKTTARLCLYSKTGEFLSETDEFPFDPAGQRAIDSVKLIRGSSEGHKAEYEIKVLFRGGKDPIFCPVDDILTTLRKELSNKITIDLDNSGEDESSVITSKIYSNFSKDEEPIKLSESSFSLDGVKMTAQNISMIADAELEEAKPTPVFVADVNDKKVTVYDLDVINNINIKKAKIDALDVTGDVTVGHRLETKGIVGSTATFSGDSSVKGTLRASNLVAANSTLSVNDSSVSVIGTTSIDGDITLTNHEREVSLTENDFTISLMGESNESVTNKKYVDDSIETERERATEEETNISNSLNAETSERIAAIDKEISDREKAVTAEKDRAETKENNLDERLTAEITRAKEEEKKISDNLTTETARASEAESALDEKITTNTNNITSLTSTIDEFKTKEQNDIDNLKGELDAESARASGVESTLTTNLANEVTRATSKENELNAAIAAEITRAEGAESTISNNIQAEFNRADAAEKANATAISTEKTRAEAAEIELSRRLDTIEGDGEGSIKSAVSAEKSRATGAELTLTTNLATEVSNREQGDTELRDSIDTTNLNLDKAKEDLNKLITDEKNRAIGEETKLSNSISKEIEDRKSAINQEVSDRTAAINAVSESLNQEVTNRNAAITQEHDRAVNVEGQLQGKITSEITRATGVEEAIRADLATYAKSLELVGGKSTNYAYTFTLKDSKGTILSEESIDLPIESVVVGGSYDAVNKKVILTLDSGKEINFSVADLIEGLVSDATFNEHVNNKNNPHDVTAAQVGLGNVDNTSDINKPISNATQAALDKKVDKVSDKSLILDTEITRLAGMSDGANKVEASTTNGNIKIDGNEVSVYNDTALSNSIESAKADISELKTIISSLEVITSQLDSDTVGKVKRVSTLGSIRGNDIY